MSRSLAPSIAVDPRLEYGRRLARHQDLAQIYSRRSLRLSVARLAAALTFLVVGAVATESDLLHPLWVVLPALAFVILVIVHRRVVREQERAHRRAAHYEAGMARLDDRWAGLGSTGADLVPVDHPYARDLDLFGRGSLFELLCTARTGSGERTLARWLLEPAPPGELHERHAAIDELRGRTDLRERLALLGDDIAGALHPEALEQWAAAPPQPLRGWRRAASLVMPVLSTLAIVGWVGLGWGPLPFLAACIAQVFVANRLRRWSGGVIEGMRRPARELGLFADLLCAIEKQPVEAPALTRLRAELQTGGVAPSRQIHKLRNLGVLLDSAANMLFAPFAFLLLWEVHLAVAVERWRTRCGPSLVVWFEAAGRFEALNALAGYAFEHPQDPFPEIADDADPCYEAVALNHPLLPARHAVANDLSLGGTVRAMVVSGSNMSGKSTLLRTVGCNAVLALAGAPVRARRLRIAPCAIGASIATVDSLHEGRSRFFTEITRLKQITDLCAAPRPVLFLLDEIFHGTNSHDRRIGAELLVRHLVGSGAIGLVTTHDLALADIAETVTTVANVHFEDQLDAGQIVFDYTLRPGTVTRSNALELMRQVGLPVGTGDQ